jgi:apocytochrome f
MLIIKGDGGSINHGHGFGQKQEICNTPDSLRKFTPHAHFMRSIFQKCKPLFIFFFGIIVLPSLSHAYPVFSQKSYPNGPREISGKIVCANCHLGERELETEIPRAVLPDTVFEVAVSVPYDATVTQLAADGGRAYVLAGSVLVLPEGFQLAPDSRLARGQKDYVDNNYIQPYGSGKENILLAGPVQPDAGDTEAKFIFPILSPNLAQGDQGKFLNYGVAAGLNIGRGQVYPTGEKSNNNVVLSDATGKVLSVEWELSGARGSAIGKKVVLETPDSSSYSGSGAVRAQSIPAGLSVAVDKGDFVTLGDPLTLDPNQGGFGQVELGLVLQSSRRIQAMIVFFLLLLLPKFF